MEHLNEKSRLMLSDSNERRIEFINSDFWIGYENAKQLLDSFNELLNRPKVIRMPSILLVGSTNNGKTALLKRFYESQKAKIDSNNNVTRPLIHLIAPTQGNISELYNDILDKTMVPFRKSNRIEYRKKIAIETLKQLKTKIIIIDEIHNLVRDLSAMKQRFALSELRYITNAADVSLLCAGIKEVHNAFKSDAQLINRFELKILENWRNDANLSRLLSSYERILPLAKPSNLIDGKIQDKLFEMSEGLLGELSIVLKRVATEAIQDGTETITLSKLNRLKWVAPSKRKTQDITYTISD
ncbi:MAG: TniB family NTP-binding protein [Chryseotalea sp.]